VTWQRLFRHLWTGADLEPGQGFKAPELADEVDKAGAHKLDSRDVVRCPVAAGVCMAACGEQAGAAFERQMLAHDEELGKMVGHVRRCLPVSGFGFRVSGFMVGHVHKCLPVSGLGFRVSLSATCTGVCRFRV
jgi:hypothetical protein